MTVADSAKQHHDTIVKEISTTVRKFHERGEKFRIRHGSTNSTRLTASKGQNFVDTITLSNILAVDELQKTCLVEPNVPMDRLVEFTLAHGLVPPVVMEFPGITVGGGFSGTSAESSSFKYGVFDRTINYVEMVLANGDIINCSGSEKTDLFHGAAGSMGTLGVITLLEVQLIAASRYVRTFYYPVTSVSHAVSTIQKLMLDQSIDYLDGILYSPKQGAIIAGRLTDVHLENDPIQTFSKAKDPWFYLHVYDEIRGRPGLPVTETIPLAEYLFRYDRGAFWAAHWAFDYFKTPFNRLTRRLLDSFMHTRVLFTAQDASELSHQYVAQDLPLPFARAVEFIDYTSQTFKIWPLWLCPLKPTPHTAINPLPIIENGASEPMLNVGLWGPGPKHREEFIALNRDLERKLVELSGWKILYAHTFYTEAEFWAIYDRDWYDSLRSKYGATSLPSIYEKVKPYFGAKESIRDRIINTRPLGGLYGVLKTVMSDEYRRGRVSRQKERMTNA